MDSAGSSPAPDFPCGHCQAERAPYTCPRCHLRFCSVPCYRDHGSCAQDFQSRELELSLRGLRGDKASQRRLREALLRLQELREPGDEGLSIGLNPDVEQEEALWEQLSPGQRKHFQRLLSSGQISRLLPAWEPWWVGGRNCDGAALIQELQGDSRDAQEQEPHQHPEASLQQPPLPTHPEEASTTSTRRLRQQAVPTLPSSIPPLASLTRTPASPLVRFQLPNVLYAYAYALALYNGEADEAEMLPEFCETVLDVSGALGAKQVFHSTSEALQAALQALAMGQYPECLLGNAEVMVAVAQILMGECQAQQKGFSLAALTHMAQLLSKGKRRLPAQDRARISVAQKKCEFLLSWVNENEVALSLLALEVQQEYHAHLDMVKEVGAVSQELERMWGAKVPPPKKPLIEELD
ncbi:zinc finger HIT domain-containing protein 2 [Lacerta agilis]|uniref:zinc finger HIT domain-containing protein 2 n=1 Tax=Lacerta agilis TaxID=80427 RepID=UPI0014191EDD|nr:zinc finger HIT domain-containing protein 2 [Lacerta agilis]